MELLFETIELFNLPALRVRYRVVIHEATQTRSSIVIMQSGRFSVQTTRPLTRETIDLCAIDLTRKIMEGHTP